MAVIRAPLRYPTGISPIAAMLQRVGPGITDTIRANRSEQDRVRAEEDRQRRILFEDENRQVQKYNVLKDVIGQTSGFEGGDLGEAFVPTPSQPEGGSITAGAPIDGLQNPLGGPAGEAFNAILSGGGPDTTVEQPPAPGTELTAPELTVRDATPITTKERVTTKVLGHTVPIPFREERESEAAGASLRQAMAQQGIDIQTGKVHQVTADDIASLPEDLRGMFEVGQLVAPGALTGVHMKAFEVMEANKTRLAQAQASADEWNRRNAKTQGQTIEREVRAEGRADRKHEVKNEDDFLANTATGWQDFDDTMYTAGDFGKRGGVNVASAKAFAKKHNRKMVGKDLGRETLQAKATLADISRLENLLKDEKVTDWLGAYAGRIVDWESKGWVDFLGDVPDIPKGVTEFRSTLNRLAAKERHEIYGAAVTPTEAKFAEGFIPSITSGYATMLANINEARDDLVRALDVGWGQMEGTFDAEGRIVPPDGVSEAAGGNDPLGIR